MTSMDPQYSSVSKPCPQRGGNPLVRPMRGLLRVLLISCLAGVHALIPKIAAGQEDLASEYELKAAILYNLTRFVEWPPAAYPDPQAPIVLCVLGRDPFRESLKARGQKQDANGRPVSIRRLKEENEIRDCHVLYISTSERKSMAQILSRLKGSSVLTVGEMSQFAAQGGIVQFTLEDKQVRFEINLDAASRMTLKISSRLLVLARIVKDQGHDGGKIGALGAAAPFGMAGANSPSSAEKEHAAGSEMSATTPGKAQKSR